jgi:hypothetical protein
MHFLSLYPSIQHTTATTNDEMDALGRWPIVAVLVLATVTDNDPLGRFRQVHELPNRAGLRSAAAP